jgi:hypothetical protein
VSGYKRAAKSVLVVQEILKERRRLDREARATGG